ncbi:DNA cytosine methyltransferase [Stenotrophomonas sp. B1-1]|uniref:DNA cytosine methyltransferase n=1 Tax=Stenotrophomonas sp. B1-1 TaxID=2710648 RepID=UPI00196714F1|nr:DNA cytosine methyltransferase [Stenotrophomonas sp. B1-1]
MRDETQLTFVDVFAGCGGLSLGLMKSGWRGQFAIEKNPDAFATLSANLIASPRKKDQFLWPEWLPKQAWDISQVLSNYEKNVSELCGSIDLLAGGPPCQGFSLAGRRNNNDPRNRLTEEYIRLVKLAKPRILLIENVRGFNMAFKKTSDDSYEVAYSEKVSQQLKDCGYRVFSSLVDLSRYGVPQKRRRFILIAIKEHDVALTRLGDASPFDVLERERRRFLSDKGLAFDRSVTAREAIGDLEVDGSELIDCNDSSVSGFRQIAYAPRYTSPYIKLMRRQGNSSPDSLRLPRHSESTRATFALVMNTCDKGKTISADDRARLGIKKQALTPLRDDAPSATITTLPDDIIHYSEARVLTARENARLQSFPDNYRFVGKYTTGGKNRRIDCPRYTQIGNAVPPLFAEAVGRMLKGLIKS